MLLEEAIEQGILNGDNIIKKCESDRKNNKVKTSEYRDGGTILYSYDKIPGAFGIIKCNTLDGIKDLYIGMPGMEFNGKSVGYRSIRE